MINNYHGGKYTLTRKKYTDAYPRRYIIDKINELKPTNDIPMSKADKGYIAYKLYKIGKDMNIQIEEPEKKQKIKQEKKQEIKQEIKQTDNITEEDEIYIDNDNHLDIQYQDYYGRKRTRPRPLTHYSPYLI